MRIFAFGLSLGLLLSSCTDKKLVDFTTYYEKSEGIASAPYEIGMAYWKLLDKEFKQLKVLKYGKTDCGEPLHLAVWSYDKQFDPKRVLKNEKSIILINNAIHPGEPDGVDASMMLLRDILQSEELQKKYKDVVICVIPYYNIGGALNRNSTTRTNQNGPEAYGFRGNSRNFDLNRDFIKMDSKNMWAFTEIFHDWQPHIFLDNHVSNGADYQHVMTYLATQEDKLGGPLGDYMKRELNPFLEQDMKQKNFPLTPYVNVWGDTPDKAGINQFYDSPRYSSGYASLFHTIGYVAETHMLKPYKQRTEATYQLMASLLDHMSAHTSELVNLKNAQKNYYLDKESLALNWELNQDQADSITFLGYEASMKPSKIGDHDRLFYDRTQPFNKQIAYRNQFLPKDEIAIPYAYIIPQSEYRIIDRLKANGITMKAIEKDTMISVGQYHYEDFKTNKNPYEGHYLHSNTKVKSSVASIAFRKGDMMVSTKQPGKRFIVETLEPVAIDSYFNWNFFDIYLQQKEGFSPYVFEDKAFELLSKDTILKNEFEMLKANDSTFAKNGYTQLQWIHRHSNHYEKSHLRHPIFRVE